MSIKSITYIVDYFIFPNQFSGLIQCDQERLDSTDCVVLAFSVSYVRVYC